MEADPWGTSGGDDPWAIKPDVLKLASSRLAQFDGPATFQDMDDGGFGAHEERPSSPQTINAMWQPVAIAGGEESAVSGWGTDEALSLPMVFPTPAKWEPSSEEEPDAWDRQISDPAISSKPIAGSLPVKPADTIQDPMSRPVTPGPMTVPLPDSPFPSPPHSRSPTPVTILPKSSPITPVHKVSFAFSPASPTFSDDGGGFGNFSSGLPSTNAPGFGMSQGFGVDEGGDDDWGRMDLGAAEEEAMPSWGGADPVDEADLNGLDPKGAQPGHDVEHDDGSGADRMTLPDSASHGDKEDEWEAERKRAAKREARAPAELVNRLEAAWKKVAEEVCGFPIGDDGLALGEGGLTSEMENQRDGLLYELSLRPASLDTYPEPFNSTHTHKLYLQALAQPLDPATSLLARASQRAFRQRTPAGVVAADWNTDWLARSRLGETHEEPVETESITIQATPQTLFASGKGRWSLWGRAPSGTVPLTTSGGGMLEIKDLTPNSTGTPAVNTPPESKQSQVVPSYSGTSASAPSAVAGPETPSKASPAPSRIASPKPPPIASPVVKTDPPARNSESQAVGRFFGRFRRARASSPSVDIDTQDIQLSHDDVGFLGQVPAITAAPAEKLEAQRGVADLLSMDTFSAEQDAVRLTPPTSLQTVLAQGAHLAPPIPRRTSSSRDQKDRADFGSSIFSDGRTARPSVTKVPSDLDLLGGMDFSGPSGDADLPGFSSTFDAFASSSSTPAPAAWGEPAVAALTTSSWAAPISSASPPAFSWPSETPADMASVSDFGAFGGALNCDIATSAKHAQTASDDYGDADDFGDFADAAATGGAGDLNGAFDFATPRLGSQAEFSSMNGGGSQGRAFASTDFSSFPSDQANQFTFTDNTSPPPPSPPAQSDPYDFSDFLSSTSKPVPTLPVPVSKHPKPTISLSALSASENLVASASRQTARWPAPASPAVEGLPPPPSGPGTGGVGRKDLLGGDFGLGSANGSKGTADGSFLGFGNVQESSSNTAGSANLGGFRSMGDMDIFSTFAAAPAPIAQATGSTAGQAKGAKGAGLSKADLSFFDSL